MTRPPLRRSDGGPLVAALSAVAAAGALVCYLLPFLYVVLPLLVVVALAAAAGRRELRIRRRLRGIEVDSPGQSLPAPRVALPAAQLQIEDGASL